MRSLNQLQVQRHRGVFADTMSSFCHVVEITECIFPAAGLVGKLNPKNKVDLTTPELTIIVEVIKAVCCVSVVKDYTLYRKYNVQEVVKDETLRADVNTAKTESNTAEQKEAEDPEETGKEKREDEENGIKTVQQDNAAVDKSESNIE